MHNTTTTWSHDTVALTLPHEPAKKKKKKKVKQRKKIHHIRSRPEAKSTLYHVCYATGKNRRVHKCVTTTASIENNLPLIHNSLGANPPKNYRLVARLAAHHSFVRRGSKKKMMIEKESARGEVHAIVDYSVGTVVPAFLEAMECAEMAEAGAFF